MENTIIFRELPETFPEKDKYKKPSIVTSLFIHVGLVFILLFIPFVFVESIPQFQLLTVLVAPPPPPPAAPAPPILVEGAARPVAPQPTPIKPPAPDTLIMPTVVPKEIARVVDIPVGAEFGVPGGVIGGVPGGVVGGVLGNILARNAALTAPLPEAAPPPPPPPPPPKITVPSDPIRVGGDVREPRVVRLIPPKYPPLASRARVQGKVVLEATLREDGTVDAIRVVSGHPLLVNAAIDAVKQWVYEPTLLNGHPVAVILTAIVTFNQPVPSSD